MKYRGLLIVIGFILIGLTSCKTTKLVPVGDEDQVEQSSTAEGTVAGQGDRGGRRGEGGQRGGGGRGAQNQEAFNAMVASLNLNGEQKVQFDAINESFQAKMRTKREEARSSGGFEGMREQMAKLRDDQNGALKNLLTDSQYQIYSSFQEEQQKNREARRGRRGN